MDINASVVTQNITVNLPAGATESTKAYALIKELVCYNQGEFIQFYYKTSELHRALKDYLRSTKSPEQTRVARLTKILVDYINQATEDICKTNFQYLLAHFGARESTQPRICLKSFSSPNSPEVISIFRSNKVPYDTPGSYKEDSGLTHIVNNGTYYICDDIPKAAKTGDYLNPRLIRASAKNYEEPSHFNPLRWFGLGRDGKDEKWINCWDEITIDGQSASPDVSYCYKSTAIIPITLFKNTLRKDFSDFFQIWDHGQRTIFGFLCLDHTKTGYFREKDGDVFMGYIVADIISLYLLTRHIYTTRSKTFTEASNAVKGQESS